MIRENIEYNKDAKPNSEEMERLKEALPGYFNDEGEFMLDAFHQMLGTEEVSSTREGYRLEFLGQSYAKYQASLKTTTVIAPDAKHNADERHSQSKNAYIIGDNLDALKHLRTSYRNFFKCIYIDPPYNTGSDGFAYNDSFSVDAPELAYRLGIEEDEAQRILDLQGRASHSAWLTFMYPRLQLAKNLLTQDGAVLISIDESEFRNLNLLCDMLFGPENFVGSFVWSGGRKNDSMFISTSHEYMLCYARDFNYLVENNVSWKTRKKGLEEIYAQEQKILDEVGDDYDLASKMMRDWYKSLSESHESKRHSHYDNIDSRGVFFPDNLRKPEATSRSRYDLLHPVTGKPCNMHPNGWAFAPERMTEMVADDRIKFGADEKTRPNVKRYLRETEFEAPYSVIYKDGRAASKRLKTLMGEDVFAFPKDEEVLAEVFSMLVGKNDAVLDYFSGSGTTAHAVMNMNAKDGGNRRYVMVQLDEELNPKSKAASVKNALNMGYKTIDQIGRDRIIKAADKIQLETHANIDAGFKLFRIEEANIPAIESLMKFDESATLFAGDHVKKFATKTASGHEVIATTWMNQDKHGLSPEVQQVKLSDYILEVTENHGYIIDPGMSNDDVVELIRLLENDKLLVKKIVYLPYSMEFHVIRELKDSLKHLSGNRDVELIARY